MGIYQIVSTRRIFKHNNSRGENIENSVHPESYEDSGYS